MRSSQPFAFILFLAACGTPSLDTGLPTPDRSIVRVQEFEAAEFLTEGNRTSVTLQAPVSQVWAVLPEVYRQLGIPLSKNLPDRRTMGNDGVFLDRIEENRMSRYFDCGVTNSGLLANIYDVTLSIDTRLMDAPESGTVVTSTVDAWARPRVTSGNPVHCLSKTTLERRFMAILAEMLGVDPPGVR